MAENSSRINIGAEFIDEKFLLYVPVEPVEISHAEHTNFSLDLEKDTTTH